MEEILRGRGHGLVADRIEHAYRALWHRCQDLYWSEDRDVPCRRQIEHFLEELDLSPSTFEEPVLAELEHAYAQRRWSPPEPVDGAVRRGALQGARLRVGLIATRRSPARPEHLIARGDGVVDDVMYSTMTSHCKPRPSISRAPARLDVRLGDSLVGDNLYAECSAQAAHARVHFDPHTRGTAVAPTWSMCWRLCGCAGDDARRTGSYHRNDER